MQPEVSVIVPNYNHHQFIKRRIESILNQTFRDFELIILDDCSKDESKDIIESYKSHPKVSKIIYNEINSGSPFLQWKKGVDNASGKYIWIAESDDWCEETLLKELLEPFLKHEELVLSHCQVVWHENNIIKPFLRFNKLSEVCSGQEFIVNRLLYQNNIPNASAVVFKKEAYNKVSADYTKMKFCGDWYVWYNILKHGHIHTSGKFLSYYNKHPQDVTNSSKKNGLLFLEGLRITQSILASFEVSYNLQSKAKHNWVKKYFQLKHQHIDKSIDTVIERELIATFHLNPFLLTKLGNSGYTLMTSLLKK